MQKKKLKNNVIHKYEVIEIYLFPNVYYTLKHTELPYKRK
jgi:hypothetical protein